LISTTNKKKSKSKHGEGSNRRKDCHNDHHSQREGEKEIKYEKYEEMEEL